MKQYRSYVMLNGIRYDCVVDVWLDSPTQKVETSPTVFSPDEQRKIQAKSLAQWQQDQRAKVLAHDQKLMYLGPDPMYNDPKDLELLKSLRISPA